MSEPVDSPDWDAQMLARLAVRDVSAAERVHDKLMAAEAPAEVAELARAYQRLGRCVRQTLALKGQLRRERERAAADPPAPPAKPGGVALARRIRELRTAVMRVVWNEVERGDVETADWHEEALAETIAEECLKDSFCAEPLDDHVARICLAMGLSAEAAVTWRDLPDAPPPAVGDDEPPHESSA